MITYQVDNFANSLDGVKALAGMHWEEVGLYKDKIMLDPDWDKFLVLDKAGIVRLPTVRKDGIMIGYAIFMLYPLIHYKSHTAAVNDAVFLLPKHRGVVGYKFIKYCHEQMLKEAPRVTWHLKVAHDWGNVLKHLGYELEEYLYGYCKL